MIELDQVIRSEHGDLLAQIERVGAVLVLRMNSYPVGTSSNSCKK